MKPSDFFLNIVKKCALVKSCLTSVTYLNSIIYFPCKTRQQCLERFQRCSAKWICKKWNICYSFYVYGLINHGYVLIGYNLVPSDPLLNKVLAGQKFLNLTDTWK